MGKRMYYILTIIQQSKGKAISGKDILKKLEEYDIYLDIKTVYSCIKQINEFFYEWIGTNMIVSMKKVGFYIDQEFFLDGELQFLLDSISFHQDLNYEDKMKLKDKLLLLSSEHQHSRLVEYQPQNKQQSFSLILNLSTIMKAIENQKTIAFQYINYDVKGKQLKEIASPYGNNDKQYIVSPYQIVSNNNHYYLIGYNDKHKNTLSTYRIDRMRLVTTSKYPFIEIREQYDMNEEIEKMTNMFSTQKKDILKIECQQRLLREMVSRFGIDIKVEKLHHDYYTLTIEDVAISEGLIGWLMMLQDGVKVIYPLSLKEEIKNRIHKMKELYEK